METLLTLIKKIVPKPVFKLFQPAYHFSLATLSAFIYRFPSRNIKIVAVTGTKGKSSVVELVSSILEAHGEKTALLNTIRFKIGDTSTPNKYKMSVPGRFFVQRFIAQAVSAGCTYIALEMTSEGAKQFRHCYIDYDALIFTNLTPEHIESHGSFEKYREAKLSIARKLLTSKKENPALVVNSDSPQAEHFINVRVKNTITYSKSSIANLVMDESGISFTYNGTEYTSKLHGIFNVENILAAISWAESVGIPSSDIAKGIASVNMIQGRLEAIECGQNFDVYVDYAHTPESLMAVYKTFSDKRKICVLGATGGGRDTKKRAQMGKIADEYCEHIIVTDEDPYDESPQAIIEDVASGVLTHTPEKILSRKDAIRKALSLARAHDVVLITGKGTDPYIMRAQGKKEVWNDAEVTKSLLKKLLTTQKN